MHWDRSFLAHAGAHFTPVLLSTTAILAVLIFWRRRRAVLPLPPGPPGRFLYGNVDELAAEHEHLLHHELAKKYGASRLVVPPDATHVRVGDIVYLNALGQPFILIGSQKAAVDLLEKRSAIYSDRKFSFMAELADFTWFFAISPYGRHWRKARRAFYETMNATAVVQYRPVTERAIARYLLRLLDEPKKFRENALYMFNATIIAVTYGLDVHSKPENDKYIRIAEQTMRSFHAAFELGKYAVEVFPFVRYLPAWFPLAGFKRELPRWRADSRRLRDEPWEAAKEAMQRGTVSPCMASTLIGDSKTDDEVNIAKGACASAYAGERRHMFSTFDMFVAAMALFPDVQARAQAELDSVIGRDRLPTIRDKGRLPYTAALVTEVYRWQPVVPVGVPHHVMEDDDYNGYRIPRGAMTMQNPWAYSRDPHMYPDPEEFQPERFFKDGRLHLGERDPSLFVFGYGRRYPILTLHTLMICPGRHFAEDVLFATIASVLHSFTILGPRDDDGHPKKVELKFTNTSPMHPEPFGGEIQPRSAEFAKVIRTSYANGETDGI
ncbi:cytochrome P450 [Daedaleopsis nitida]|nr:cytochrome P450 [Daedaleopsis nitida]